MTDVKPDFDDRFRELPPEAGAAVDVIERLTGAGHAAFLVGGAVRNLALGLPPGDFDVATAARPERIAELFPHTKFVGAAFGVTLVVVGDHRIEVATFRRERSYLDGRHPDKVEFSDSPAEDALRRDFTVNALYLDPRSGEILDTVAGLDDCRARILRTVGVPADRFSEDGLRLLRASRLAAGCELEVAQGTLDAMRDCRDMLRAVSPERLGEELSAMLTGPSPSRALNLLRETGLLDLFLPEVSALHGVPQPPDYHPEGDVWTHTMLMLDQVKQPDLVLALGVLLHDIGKPTAFRQVDGRIRFHGHERSGEVMSRDVLDRLRFPRAIAERVSWLVSQHMRFFDARLMRPSTLKRFIRQEHFPALLELHRLDKAAADGDMSLHDFCRERRAAATAEELAPRPLLSGEDLLALGVPPGPRVGALLRELETMQLEGRLRDPEAARRWV
ncbi:CCA tRNA nucleotidyltransferase, partial [bacterium]|nr:CCA tRNA nucleotidyltransferase [bacterium]